MKETRSLRFAGVWRSTLLLAGLFAGGYSSLALAQDVEDNAATADSADSVDTSDSADSAKVTTGTALLPAFVTAGVIDPNGKVPTYNGVAGAGVPNLDVSSPLTVLTHGKSYSITVALQDYNYTGDYEVDYYIKQTVKGVTKTILQHSIVTGKSTKPGESWAWDIYSADIPDSPGTATLYGRVRWGTSYSVQALVSTKIVIK